MYSDELFHLVWDGSLNMSREQRLEIQTILVRCTSVPEVCIYTDWQKRLYYSTYEKL